MAASGNIPTPTTRLEPESSLSPCAFTFTRQASCTTSSASKRAHSGMTWIRSFAADLTKVRKHTIHVAHQDERRCFWEAYAVHLTLELFFLNSVVAGLHKKKKKSIPL